MISLFPFAFTPDPAFLQQYMPGCIWIAALLGSLLSIEYVFAAELEEGHLEQLILSATSLPIILLIKLAAHWTLTQLPLILLIPLIGFLFNLSLPIVVTLMISLLLGTPILLLMGAFGAAITLGLRQQGALLSLLILPLLTPVLIFGVNMVQQVQAGLRIAGSLAFLGGLSVLAITILPLVIASVLRLSLAD